MRHYSFVMDYGVSKYFLFSSFIQKGHIKSSRKDIHNVTDDLYYLLYFKLYINI